MNRSRRVVTSFIMLAALVSCAKNKKIAEDFESAKDSLAPPQVLELAQVPPQVTQEPTPEPTPTPDNQLPEMTPAGVEATPVAIPTPTPTEKVVWRDTKMAWSGKGCNFGAWNDPGQDAWVVVAGDELSIVFSNLGGAFDPKRKGIQTSVCNITIPSQISTNTYVKEVSQTIFYGISKTAGVSAKLSAVSNFARRLPNGRSLVADLWQNMAYATVDFKKGDATDISLATMKTVPVRVKRDDRKSSIWTRFCSKNRTFDLNYHTSIGLAVRFYDPKAQISVAVDGFDLKYVMAPTLEKCDYLQHH